MAAVRVLDRRLREFFIGRVIQASDVDRVKLPRFAAERAIAAGRASGQIEVAFKLDCAAVATAFVCLYHPGLL